MNRLLLLIALVLLVLLVAPIQMVSSFALPNAGNRRDVRSSKTSLFGTMRFVGNANASIKTPAIAPDPDSDEDMSLSRFLTSSACDEVLLGTKTFRRMNDESSGGGGELWECRQAGVGWFGMTVVPIFINRIEKDPSRRNVVVSIIDAQTEVKDGGRIGGALASAMKRSRFEGRNAVTWKELGSEAGSGAPTYALEGNLRLTLEISLPPFLPLPPGFNKIGSKIVERTCKERLRQNLLDITDAYLVWATTP